MVVKIETSLTTWWNPPYLHLIGQWRPPASYPQLHAGLEGFLGCIQGFRCKCNSESCSVSSCCFFLNYITSRCACGDFRLVNTFQSWAKVRHLYSRPSRLGVARQGSSGFMLLLTGQAVTCRVEGGGILNWWLEPEVGMRHAVTCSCY